MKYSEVDALIVGAGPAGLVAALWLAKAGIKAIMVDQKPAHTEKGHADGVEARTFEILDSFGIGEKCWSEANHTLEVCIWDRTSEGSIFRESVAANGIPGFSRYHEGTLGQGRIEGYMLSLIQHSSVQIMRQTWPVSLDVDTNSIHDFDSHCITVRLETGSADGSIQTHNIKTRYLLGCDGAHSWVRKQIGLKMEGDGQMESWGVMDCVPVTTFPDVRKRCVIKSENGNMMIIPRERKLCRIYVQLSPEGARAYKANRNSEIVVAAIQKILGQYEFRANIIEWCTTYTTGHRVCSQASMYERIFLAGDALHTHTAKAGKGMNLSMQDTFNLGWKLGSVLLGVTNPSILKTYQLERMQTARRLVTFDRRLYSEISSRDQDLKRLRQALRDENTLESGMAVVYPTSVITGSPATSEFLGVDCNSFSRSMCLDMPMKQGLTVGGRIPSAPLVRQCDVRPVELQKLLPATGQWHLLVFGGNISQASQMEQVHELAFKISTGRFSNIFNTRPDQQLMGTVKAYLLHSAPRLSVELDQLPELFLPSDEMYGFDYDRIYADSVDPSKLPTYEKLSIPAEGCMVLVRPDQHISLIAPLQEYALLDDFFSHAVPATLMV